MKTIIKFDTLVADMLERNGNDVEAVINACQSDANSARGVDGNSKRGDFRGGQSYKADGTLMVKPIKFKEQNTVDYTIAVVDGKIPAPAELVKWHDSLCRHWKQTGRPNGKLPVDMLPSHLALWLSVKCRAKDKAETKPTPAPEVKGRNGNIEKVGTPV